MRQLLGIELAKGHARTDWARRPLSAEQLAYAADDVRYLPALVESLESRLDAAGRRAWLAQESAALADIALYRVEPAEAWRRLKGLERLDAPAFAAARGLAEWRERRAMARNLPRGWILPDAAIHELARRDPRRARRSRASLRCRRALPRARRRSCSRRSPPLPPTTRGTNRGDPGRPGPEQLRLQKALQARLAAIAAELGIQPEVLATRRELAALARGERDVPSMGGWRKAIVGERLLAAL